jgi:hypothetical protein
MRIKSPRHPADDRGWNAMQRVKAATQQTAAAQREAASSAGCG